MRCEWVLVSVCVCVSEFVERDRVLVLHGQ